MKEPKFVVQHRAMLVTVAYRHYVENFQSLAGGAVESAIVRSLKTIANLLAERPEAEQVLFSL